MFAVLVNTATITIGVLLGLLLRRGLPDSLSTSLLRGLGLCTIVIGVSGAIHGDVLVMILAISSGLAIGELFGLEERVNAAAERLTARFTGGAGQGARLGDCRSSGCGFAG